LGERTSGSFYDPGYVIFVRCVHQSKAVIMPT
jgi:hypothetical protein